MKKVFRKDTSNMAKSTTTKSVKSAKGSTAKPMKQCDCGGKHGRR